MKRDMTMERKAQFTLEQLYISPFTARRRLRQPNDAGRYGV